MLYLMDYLGGANYHKLIKDEHPPGFGAGFILNTNKPEWPKTDAWPVIRDLLDLNCPAFRLHALWQDSHKYDPSSHDKIIFAELETACRIQETCTAQVYFSPFCEMDTRGAVVPNLFKRLGKEKHPRIILVNSIAGGDPVEGIITEVHGGHPKPRGTYAYSFDGNQAYDANVQRIKRSFSNAEYIAFWCSHCNGKWNDKAGNEKDADRTPRNNREAWLYTKLLRSLAFLGTDAGAVTMSSRHIWKTHADQHQAKPNARDGKPVLITPAKAKSCEILLADGRVLAKMAWTDIYKPDGRQMYRIGKWGYELAEEAIKLQGNPIVTLQINGQAIAKINPGFRSGSWR